VIEEENERERVNEREGKRDINQIDVA